MRIWDWGEALPEEKVEGFGDAGAAAGPGEVAALFFDLRQNLRVGVGGASEGVAVTTLEHREIVQVIPSNKGGGWPQI